MTSSIGTGRVRARLFMLGLAMLCISLLCGPCLGDAGLMEEPEEVDEGEVKKDIGQAASPAFIGIYLLISIVLLVLGVFWVRNDDTKNMDIPGTDRMTPYHVAVLVGSRLEAVKTAIVCLVHHGYARIQGTPPRGRNEMARYFIASVPSAGQPSGRIEAGVHSLLTAQGQELYLFVPKATSLSSVGNDLQAIESELREMRVLRTKEDTMHTLKIGTMLLVPLLLIGIIGAVVGAGSGESVFLLVLLMLFVSVFFFPVLIMASGHETTLGRRTIKAFDKQYGSAYWDVNRGNVPPGVDYRYVVAINGVGVGARLMGVDLPASAWAGFVSADVG